MMFPKKNPWLLSYDYSYRLSLNALGEVVNEP